MADKEQIKTLLKEAELYGKQGLLVQARDKYLKIQDMVRADSRLSELKELVSAVEKKISEVEDQLTAVDKAPVAPQLPEEVQDLIKKQFAFSGDKKKAAFEGAMALAKFGQYEKALVEFENLLEKGIMPRIAAKNILTLYITYDTPEKAIKQFDDWINKKTLSLKELRYIRDILDESLKNKGIEVELPKLGPSAPKKKEAKKADEDDVLYISSVSVEIQEGPRRGDMVEFDVTVQSGKNISVIISKQDKEILDSFEVGIRLPDIQCYSPIGLFRGNGVVLGKNVIKDGPKRGDWVLDITVETL